MSKTVRHNQNGSVTVTRRFKQFGTIHTTSTKYASYGEYLKKEQELNKKASNAITKGVLTVIFFPFILIFKFYKFFLYDLWVMLFGNKKSK